MYRVDSRYGTFQYRSVRWPAPGGGGGSGDSKNNRDGDPGVADWAGRCAVLLRQLRLQVQEAPAVPAPQGGRHLWLHLLAVPPPGRIWAPALILPVET